MTAEKQKKLLINIAFYTVAAVFVYILARLITGPLLPFALAFGLATVLQGAIRWLCEKFRFKKGFASVALVLVVYTVVGVTTVWLIRALYGQVSDLVTTLPQYSDSISEAFSYISEKIKTIFGSMPEILSEEIPSTAINTLAENLGQAISGVATDFAKAIPSFLLSVAVTVIAGAYFAKDYGKIMDSVNRLIPQSILERLVFIKDVILKKLGKMLKGYLVIVSMTFFELLVGLGLLKVKYALVIALVTAFVDILPVLGSGTVLIPWAVVSGLSGNTGKAIGLVILYIVVTVVRNVTEPKIIGSKLGIHPVLMLAAVFVGLKIFGGVGVIVVPLGVVVVKSLIESRSQSQSKDQAQNQTTAS
ncbi:MAG: sporulation integral membrane protein YtvI [Clostridia bacterium]|nr:sporulation integral membrane protein YtvI [Clostridia bacterium]